MPGVIAPRKAVSEVLKLLEDPTQDVKIEISAAKARFQFGDVVLTTKLIDGTFPDYQRVIPKGNDKRLVVDKEPFEKAVDRVSTLSSERGRAIKLSIADGKMTLSVNNPDSGSASEEIEIDYDSDPIDIGFNARYLLDIIGQLVRRHRPHQDCRPGLPDPDPGPRRRQRALRADAAEGVEPLSRRERGRGEGIIRSWLRIDGSSLALCAKILRPRKQILWEHLRGSRFHGAKFRRQVPFDRYVLDFYCRSAKLVVELDGRQHDGSRTTTPVGRKSPNAWACA